MRDVSQTKTKKENEMDISVWISRTATSGEAIKAIKAVERCGMCRERPVIIVIDKRVNAKRPRYRTWCARCDEYRWER